MKEQIRRNTFETNSSSVHTLCIDKSGREPSELKLDKDGKINVYLNEFGANYELYNYQDEKLSYLMTLLKYASRGFDIESIYEEDQFKYIEKAIMNYIPECTGIKICGDIEDGYIDHQSQPEYGEISIINPYDEDDVINFVFNKYISLKTDRD